MEHGTSGVPFVTIGLDLGDKFSHFFALSTGGEILQEARVASRPEVFRECFSRWSGGRVVIEASTHSPWASRTLSACGLEVVVANSRQAALISQSQRKSDRVDAELLARLGRVDPQLLRPIRHRSPEAQQDLGLVKARSALVKARSGLIVLVKGQVKSFGQRIEDVTPDNFHVRAAPQLPRELQAALSGVLEAIGELTAKIREYDRKIEKLSENYPEAQLLRQIPGVGPVTSLTFVLRIDDPARFGRSRDVGAYLGLTPGQHSSGESQPQLRISKTGDRMLRCLLVQCAHHILHRGPDSDLKRHGKAIAERGGKNSRKRAVVAVARKLAVLMHRLWVSEQPYDPLRNWRKKQPPGAESMA